MPASGGRERWIVVASDRDVLQTLAASLGLGS
jgi:hypothetical protein